MIRILIFCFCCIPFFVYAQHFQLEGKAQLNTGNKIYLIYETGGQRITDSALVRDGSFTFRGNLEFPVLAGLYLHTNPYENRSVKNMDYYRLYIEPGHLKVTSPDSLKNSTVQGSSANRDWETLKKMRKPNDEKFDRFSRQNQVFFSQKQPQDKRIYDSLLQIEKQLMLEMYSIRLRFAEKKPDSYIGLISLAAAASQASLADDVQKAYEAVPANLKKTALGKTVPVLLQAHQNIQIGKPAPAFSEKSSTGSLVHFADFKGQYVLLDFWASWCGPCREENPNLVNMYKKYHHNGFTIVSVSLDRAGDRERWLQAIGKDQLTWPQLSSLNGWDSPVAKQYAVNALPSNFLIDPQGKIIAKDLRSEGLGKELEKIFGH